MLTRSVAIASLILVVQTPTSKAQPDAHRRAKAVSLFSEAVRLKASWKTDDEYVRAESLASAAKEIDPTYEPAVLDRYRADSASRDFFIDDSQDWMKTLRELLNANPKSNQTRFELARIMSSIDKQNRGAEKYQKDISDLIGEMLALDPSSGDAYLLRAGQSVAQGKLDTALTSVNRAIDLPLSHKYLAYATRAELFMTMTLNRSAIEDFSKASSILEHQVQKVPKSEYQRWKVTTRQRFWANKAICYNRLGEKQEYENAVKAAVDLVRKPDVADVAGELTLLIRRACKEGEKHKTIPWDEYGGTIEGLIDRSKKK